MIYYKMTSGYVYVILLRECISQKLNIFKIGRTTDIFTRYKAYPKGSKLLFLHYVDNCIQAESDIIQTLKTSNTITQKLDYGLEYFEGHFIDLSQIVYHCSISAREKNADTHYIFRLHPIQSSQQPLERYATSHKTLHADSQPSLLPSDTGDAQTNITQAGTHTESDNTHILDQEGNQMDTSTSSDMQNAQTDKVSQKQSPTKSVKEFLEQNKDFYDGKNVKINVLYDALCNWLQEKNRHQVNQRILSACIKEEFGIEHKSHRFPDGIHQAYDFTHLDMTDTNFLRFVHENIRKKANGFFTLQQAKDAYIEKEYCTFNFKYFKEQLEKYLDTLCIHRKSINGKIRNSVFLGYDIHTLSRQEKSNHYQIHNHIYDFLDENIVESPGTLLSMRDIMTSYARSCNSNKKRIDEVQVERYLCTQMIPQKNIDGRVYKNVFEGYQLKNVNSEGDAFLDWFREFVIMTNNTSDMVKAVDVYKHYHNRKNTHDKSLSKVEFGRLFKSKTGIKSSSLNGTRVYRRVRMNDNTQSLPAIEDDN